MSDPIRQIVLHLVLRPDSLSFRGILIGPTRNGQFCSPPLHRGRRVAFRHRTERHRLDLLGVAGLAEGEHAGDADFFHGGAGRLEVVAGVEFFRRLGEHFADGAGDGQAVVGVDVDLHVVVE